MTASSPYLFDTPLSFQDPEVARLCDAEAGRQRAKLILIASESLCPRPVQEALTSPFSALYAEGYPSTRMSGPERDSVHDVDRHLAFNRRYADRRYYKGCEYVNFIEVLAQKRAAEVFATNGLRPDDLHVNVQSLSGSAANNAIYQAFVKPGDVVMGMALPHGGHLTHGSEFNRSGKLYRIVPYMLDERTGRLDYDAIKDAARRHQPRMLIAGASAYPWEIDWKALREAADQVAQGCTLLADISHPAGLVAAGEFPSPVGYADVISMTTHKTLCGPRGAIIVTTDRDRAEAIDVAVFPGEQGGPHVHQIAAKAVAFGMAQTPTFRELMHRIRQNASVLCSTLAELGLKIQGGGTSSHLFLVDLKGSRKASGVPLYGDIAANLLDLCNITLNKNTIPQDASAAHPTGIRIGTTVVSQQGFGEEHMRKLARLIHRVVAAAETFSVTTGGGLRGRARIDHDVMEEVRAGVLELTGSVVPEDFSSEIAAPKGRSAQALRVRGERAGAFLQAVVTTDVLGLRGDETQRTLLLDRAGRVFAEGALKRITVPGETEAFDLHLHPEAVLPVAKWLRGLSDGYLTFDDDLTRKIDGPVAIHTATSPPAAPQASLLAPALAEARQPGKERLKSDPSRFALEKPWFIGRAALDLDRRVGDLAAPYEWVAPSANGLKKTSLNELHRKLAGARNLVPFAGWEMPVLYTSILEEHRAVRRAGGLFDLSHMGTIEVSGAGATRFLDLLTTNFIWKLRPGQSQYGFILKPDGGVMDDLLVYMLGEERFMVVCNASNEDEVLAHLRRARAGEARLSDERPDARLDAHPRVRSLKDPAEAGDAMRVDLGLQGPRTREVLVRLAGNDGAAGRRVSALHRSEQIEIELGGFDLIVSRTGYTGEPLGYEIFVHPDRSPELWIRLLEIGADLGIVPAGLGARDSLRCEAGFPLYGHELAGPFDLLPAEAGYAAFVKEHKPFFVGREPHLARSRSSKRRIARLRFEHSGIRMFQPGNPVVNARGQVIGAITSAVLPGEHQLALALVDASATRSGTRLGAFPPTRKNETLGSKPLAELAVGDTVPVPEPAVVVPRFPKSCAEEESCGAA